MIGNGAQVPVGAAFGQTAWWWGTNRPGGTYYAGRVHVVHPEQRATGVCGLPVDDVWELRPSTPDHLCPDCCVLAMTVSYPPFPTVPPRLPDWFESAGISAYRSTEQRVEQTVVLPAVQPNDPGPRAVGARIVDERETR